MSTPYCQHSPRNHQLSALSSVFDFAPERYVILSTSSRLYIATEFLPFTQAGQAPREQRHSNLCDSSSSHRDWLFPPIPPAAFGQDTLRRSSRGCGEEDRGRNSSSKTPLSARRVTSSVVALRGFGATVVAVVSFLPPRIISALTRDICNGGRRGGAYATASRIIVYGRPECQHSLGPSYPAV